MKTCYYTKIDEHRGVIADLVDFGQGEIHLTRINTPAQYRGQGHARRLMAEILADADREKTTLVLHISPGGGLGWVALRKWYERLGFEKRPDGMFERSPR